MISNRNRSLEGHGHPVIKHRSPSTVSTPHLNNNGVGIQGEDIPEEDDDAESEDTNSLGNIIESVHYYF